MKPRFYSKEAVTLTTILSPILGGILFSYNLREIGKSNLSPYFIAGGLVWIIFIKVLLTPISAEPLFQLIGAGVLGCLFMHFFVWDKYLSDYPDYEKKNVWKPVLIFLGICIVFMILGIWARAKS